MILSDVFLSFKGVNISNDSYVDVECISNVTESADTYTVASSLLCHTNKRDCCSSQGMRFGEWYLPSGTAAGTFDRNGGSYRIQTGDFFFARNRGPSVVHLFRGGTPSQRGRFRCEVPNADGVYKTLYANICEFTL